MRFGFAAVATTLFICAPAAATVYIVNVTIDVPNSYDPLFDKSFGASPLLDQPIASVQAGDTVNVTLQFSRPLPINYVPTVSGLPIGYVSAGITTSGVPDRPPLGPATFEVDGTGLLASDTAEFAPLFDSVATLKIADPATFSGGSLSAIRISYSVTADLGPFTRAFFLNAVPEPATWAMMLLGLGLMGTAARQVRPRRVSFD